MIKYRVNQENLNLIVEKAKLKADGVYTFRGIMYRVKNNRVTHYSDNSKILEWYGYFIVEIGRYSTEIECKKLLKGI